MAATREWLGGDRNAVLEAERIGKELAERWLRWLELECCEPVPAIRFDFFVKRTAPGKVDVSILEICELGFSMLGSSKLPEKVFGAVVRSCLGEEPLSLAGAGAVPPQPKEAFTEEGSGSAEQEWEEEPGMEDDEERAAMKRPRPPTGRE